MIEKLKSLTLLAEAAGAATTQNQEEIELIESSSSNQLDIPPIIVAENNDSEDPGAEAAAFETAFESVCLRWQSFLSLYICENASLEVNLQSDLRASALSLELDPSQLESITNVLNQILGDVLANLRDTYARFEHAFQAGAFIEQKH